MAHHYGHTGSILRLDISSGRASTVPTSIYAGFIGGRGLAAGIYWEEVPPGTKALDPENKLIVVTGPLGGLPGVSGSMWQIYGKSPATDPEQFSYCNLGGHMGAHLKFAGFDGIIIQGKAEKPVYLFLEDGKAEIRDASHLWGRGALEVRQILKSELGSQTKVLSTGPAGDNMVPFATVLAENDASGGSGFGAVMGSKNLKAIAVKGSGKVQVARPDDFDRLTKYVRELNRDKRPIPMTAYAKIPGVTEKPYACYGCICGCYKNLAVTADGEKSKKFCHSGAFYQVRVKKYYGDYNDVIVRATRLCNNYGLESRAVDSIIMWLSKCRKAGILTDESTGIPISKMGSLEFIETLARKIAMREGFGEVLALGVAAAARHVGQGSDKLIADYGSGKPALVFDPRTYITAGVIWAMESREVFWQLSDIGTLMAHWIAWVNRDLPLEKLAPGQHSPLTSLPIQDPAAVKKVLENSYVSSEVVRKVARKFWGSEAAADFTTIEGKALAAAKIQDRSYAKECLILCALVWPVQHVPHSDDHVGDPTVESKLLSAVTGKDMTPEELDLVGEKVFNLQRAIVTREGRNGRQSDRLPEFCFTEPITYERYNPDCLVPGSNGEIVSRMGATLDRTQFENVMNEYYRLRGWDVATGLQTRAKLEELGLGDVARGLGERGGTE